MAGRITMTLAVVLATAAFASSAFATPAQRADARLDRALERLVAADGGPPGIGVLIDRGGGARLRRAGVGTVPSERPFRRNEHMRIASVAKAFSGAVALTLVDHGEMALDDTIGELLPSLPAAWSRVTLAQALGHTGGLPDYIRDPDFLADLRADLRRYFSPEQLVSYVADEPLRFEPGSQYEYSDTDNIVVGLMTQSATGSSYEALLRRHVYKRLGMKRTSLPDGFLMPRPFIHGYASEPGEPPENVSQLLSMSGAWASGGIVSTPADLNRFIRAYSGGELFSSAVRGQQFEFFPGGESQPPGPGPNSAGLAIFRYDSDCGPVFGHSGSIPGYTQLAAATRNGRRSVIVSANAQLFPPPAPELFDDLRRIYNLAVCAARARR
jgi:D-alanyl-D-alanine carboxypeptidase